MDFRIEQLPEMKMVGKYLTMSQLANTTPVLWRDFMQTHKQISDRVGTELYSIQLLHPSYIDYYNPAAEFVKWAAAAVSGFDNVPPGFHPFIMPPGLYAVFLHKGAAATGAATFGYIFGTWLPSSDYVLDDRPHFEIIGERYSNNSPDSEEEIWIPIRKK